MGSAHFAFNAEDVLNVVADFVGQYVGLGEVAGGSEAGVEFFVEVEIDIDFFVGGAVEGAGGGFGGAAAGLGGIGEEHQCGWAVLRTEDLAPLRLIVIEDPGSKLACLIVGWDPGGDGRGFGAIAGNQR